jgi:hypothetical protein
MPPHETLDPQHRDETDDAEGHYHSGDQPADESPIADYTTPEHPEHPAGPEYAGVATDERSEVDGSDAESTSDTDGELTPDDDDSTRLGYGQPGHPVSEDGAPGYGNTAYEDPSSAGEQRVNGSPTDAAATEAPDEAPAGSDEPWTDVVPAAGAAEVADAAPVGHVDGHAAATEPYQGQPYDSAGGPDDDVTGPVAVDEPVVVPVAVEPVPGQPSDEPGDVAVAAAAAGVPAGSGTAAAVPAEALPGAGDAVAGTPLVSDAAGLRSRWRDVQAGFVDDPADAVRAAAGLVDEAVQAMVAALHQQRETLEATAGEARTEQLRVALRRYRTVFDRLLTDESASS